jgi:AbrB family looped-hinge helix DNA binding protein
MRSSTITSKGQITLPAVYRRALGLRPGDRLSFEEEGGIITMRKAQSVTESTAGSLTKYASTPPLTAQEMRDVAEQAIADEALERYERSGRR